MAKNSIRDYANAAASNTDVQGQNVDEGCSPAGINNAIREVMADLADVNDGTVALVSPNFDSATLGVAPNAGRSVDAFPSGTKILFQQTAAPIGWTKITTHNDKALRVVSGTAGTGGSVAFETAFASKTPSGTISGSTGSTTISLSVLDNDQYQDASGDDLTAVESVSLVNGAHTHSSGSLAFTGTAINLDVSYVDVIIASKN